MIAEALVAVVVDVVDASDGLPMPFHRQGRVHRLRVLHQDGHDVVLAVRVVVLLDVADIDPMLFQPSLRGQQQQGLQYDDVLPRAVVGDKYRVQLEMLSLFVVRIYGSGMGIGGGGFAGP